MSVDSLLIDLKHVRSEMHGINPKVSIYAKLKIREEALLKLLGGNAPAHIDHNKKAAGLLKLRNIRCAQKACPNLGQTKGGTKGIDKFGFRKRYEFCIQHRRQHEKK